MMAEPTYPLELLRSELKGAMAEQLVALIDRFATKRDLQDFRAEFIQHQIEDQSEFREINGKLDELLTEKNERDGASEMRSMLRSRRDFWVGVVVALAVSALGVLSAAPFLH